MSEPPSKPVMSGTPKVSVVIPNYNYARFLEERFRSVLDQTFQDFEILYLDDCSTDNSAEVFARFRDDPRIRESSSETNSGNAFIPVNKGVAMARGEYIWVAQADDSADHRFLQRLVDVLDRHPAVGLAYSQSLMISETGEILRSLADVRKFPDSERWTRDYVNDGMDEIRRYLMYWNTIPNLSGVVFRKSVFEAAGGAQHQLPLSGDQLTWIRMLQHSDVGFVAEPLNHFRQHGRTVREKSGYGVMVAEAYMILDYVRTHLSVNDAEMEVALEHTMKQWRKRIFHKQPRGRLKSSMTIYRAARGVDPRLHRRLLRHILKLVISDPFKKNRDTASRPHSGG